MPSPNTVPHLHPQADSVESAPTRRRFLMGAAVAAAAGTAATASHLAQAPVGAAAPEAEPVAKGADSGATGYRLSEHIRKYYKTTWI
ncbi:formate dehydrogenase [Ralstonia soli]|uniref:Formate dehydrogenase n=1 Tax=Ralstonia soli TaxID=2953896 RepID=A0ABT1ANE8_9RALS|nr:formate dehydrogenase [Ralstonia soli]MCO5399799.1 formate dehydrogenase [Ralstonia soli]